MMAIEVNDEKQIYKTRTREDDTRVKRAHELLKVTKKKMVKQKALRDLSALSMFLL